jgi:hypothetical protein
MDPEFVFFMACVCCLLFGLCFMDDNSPFD